MADLVDMKIPKKTEKELKKENTPCGPGYENGDRYPYGLELRFENDQFDKIPALKEFKVGDKVMISAEACITACRESERQGGEKNRSCEIQIEKINIESVKKKKPEQMTMKEYRKEREKK